MRPQAGARILSFFSFPFFSSWFVSPPFSAVIGHRPGYSTLNIEYIPNPVCTQIIIVPHVFLHPFPSFPSPPAPSSTFSLLLLHLPPPFPLFSASCSRHECPEPGSPGGVPARGPPGPPKSRLALPNLRRATGWSVWEKRWPSSQSCNMRDEEGSGERVKVRSLIKAWACATVVEPSGASPRLPSATAGSAGLSQGR